jgi:hypothetical protein
MSGGRPTKGAETVSRARVTIPSRRKRPDAALEASIRSRSERPAGRAQRDISGGSP